MWQDLSEWERPKIAQNIYLIYKYVKLLNLQSRQPEGRQILSKDSQIRSFIKLLQKKDALVLRKFQLLLLESIDLEQEQSVVQEFDRILLQFPNSFE